MKNAFVSDAWGGHCYLSLLLSVHNNYNRMDKIQSVYSGQVSVCLGMIKALLSFDISSQKATMQDKRQLNGFKKESDRQFSS
jgi:hypothetical protein